MDAVTVNNPDYVVLMRKGAKKPLVLVGTDKAIVEGGKRFEGNGYEPGKEVGKHFSFGYVQPTKVGLLSKKGQKGVLSDVVMAVFCGGSEVGQSVIGDEKSAIDAIMRNMNVAYETTIPDDRQVHITTNDATTEISDFAPVSADQVPEEVVFDEDLDEQQENDEGKNTHDTLGVGENTGVGNDYWRGGIGEANPFRDDFVELARQQAKAYIGPRGEMLDEFHMRWQTQGEEHATLTNVAAGGAEFARLQPPTVLNGILGGTATVWTGPNLDAAHPAVVEVGRWDGKDPETTPVTIEFAPTIETVRDGTKAPIRPFGRIHFGTRGAIITLEVDIGLGTQLTVNASYVSIDVALEPDTTGIPGLLQNNQKITGMISFLPCVRDVPVTRTLYSPFVLAAGTFFMPKLPAYAKKVLVPTELAFKLDFIDSNLNTIYSFTHAGGAGSMMLTPIYLSPDINQILLTNTSGSNSFFNVMFELEL
jgi:hypothetical protein